VDRCRKKLSLFIQMSSLAKTKASCFRLNFGRATAQSGWLLFVPPERASKYFLQSFLENLDPDERRDECEERPDSSVSLDSHFSLLNWSSV